MTERLHIQQILTRYWGYSSFRPLQEDIILAVLEGRDTLTLMPTGGGKSLCFQVPAMSKEGICIVISPLIALMKDQVQNLRKRNIPAIAIVSGMSKNEIDIALDNCAYGKEKFLYVSPERLSSEIFIERIKKMNVNLIAVDEAHCISQWGYDFRPSYLQIATLKELLPGIPVLALTATATPAVEKDIQEKLEFKNGCVFRKSFERKNLAYVVLYEENKLKRLLNILNKTPGTAIVYARTRKKAREVADFLIKNKISAEHYHAGLNSEKRSTVQENWMKEKTRIVVATNAFGMGIDKGNVRCVVHVDAPESLEAYYQEAGRAGRDEQKSYAVLLYNNSDREDIEQRFETTFPELKKIKNVYQALGNYFQLPVGAGQSVTFDFDLPAFCGTYDLPVSETYNCLRIIELQGLIAMNDDISNQSRIHFICRADALYEFQVKNPSFDHFIKVILRSYEGIFDDYIPVNEKEIALRALMSREETVSLLKRLHHLKILLYLPSSDKPKLTFLEERLDVKNFHIDRENLADRKKRYVEKAKAFLNYAESKHRCRSQMLTAYFGENNSVRCGICDYCLGRNKADISDLEFEQILDEIKKVLTREPQGIHELVDQLTPSNENKSLRVIEWLIDNEQIGYVDGRHLGWIEE